MSYRGRPSKGCESCRTRKVKCDEKKPVCSRCGKSNLDCRYRDQADLLFRNQTASAAQRAEDSWRKRSKSNQREPSESSTSNASPPSDESSPAGESYHVNIAAPQSHQSPPHRSMNAYMHNASDSAMRIPDLSTMHITPDIGADMRRRAYDRFVYDFVAPDSPDKPPEDPSDGLWVFIPQIYQNATEGSCLVTVLDAVAYANFAHRCKVPQAEALSEECMGRGIAMLSKVIADKKTAASNEALCSVYLLGVYENLTTVQRKGTYIAHQHGANALLQLRTIAQHYGDHISARLYEVTYTQMLLGVLQSAKRPPLPLRDAVNVQSFVPSTYTISNLSIIRLIWQEANLHARWHEVKQSGTLPTSRLELFELLRTALELDAEYQAWEAETPPLWKFHQEPNTPQARSRYDPKWQKLILDCNGAPEEIHDYPSLKRCWIWGFYRTSRIFLLRDTLEIINWILRLPEQVRSNSSEPSNSTGHLSPSQTQANCTLLDDMALCRHRFQVTMHLVNLIETCCSAMLGNFTVIVRPNIVDDASGMRAYVCLWTLGILDAVLGSGLIPDSNASSTTSSTVSATSTPSPFTQTPQTHDTTLPVPPQEISPSSPHSYAEAPLFSELSKLPPKKESEQHQHSPPGLDAPCSSRGSTPVIASTARKGHIFDSTPPHPYDQPVDILAFDIDPDGTNSIDVGAKREWANRLLYYIASEMGIKKALYVPMTEGFMPRVKLQVDSILGR